LQAPIIKQSIEFQTQNPMKTAHILPATTAAFALFIQGCSTENPHTGHIYLDHPQVFTRERLLNRRLAEQQWLEKQLMGDAPFSLQGSIDTRQFVGLAAAVKGNFDPLAGAQTQSALQNVQDNSRINDLQNQLQVAVLKKQIELVQNWTNGNVPSPSTNVPALTNNSTNLLSAVSTIVNMGPFTTNVPPTPNPTNRVLATSSLTSIQTLDDQLAKRNYIQALLREQELDDTHDLGGMTLYTLKFDISVLPGQNNPSIGKVSIGIDPQAKVTNAVVVAADCPNTNTADGQLSKNLVSISTIDLPSTDEFRGWLKSLNQEILEECIGQERRLYMQYLSDEEKDQLFAFAAQSIGKLDNSLMQGATAILSHAERNPRSSLWNAEFMSDFSAKHFMNTDGRLSHLSAESVTNIASHLTKIKTTDPVAYNSLPIEVRCFPLNAKYRKWLHGLLEYLKTGETGPDSAHALEYLVQERYQSALTNIVIFSDSTEQIIKIDGNDFFVCITAEDKSGAKTGYPAFTNSLETIRATWKPHVTLVEPKEYAQNISDVAARERVLSLAASLSALIPQVGASVGFDSSYVKHTQEMFDTIKRQPLLVGFANGNDEFGWILGPKFAIKPNGQLAWSHTPIQYSVQASIVVPGWWSQLRLSATNWWLSESGEQKYQTGISHFVVTLPRDYSAITRALLAKSDLSLLQPSIRPRWDANPSRRHIVVQAGNNETILIRGRDLWRNPQVLIGSQPAGQVQVLPDMAGLLASFDNVRMPAAAIPGPQVVDLSVITSGGMSVLRDGVQILPDQKNQPAAFATLQSTYLTSGGQLIFAIDPSLLPKTYGQLTLLLGDPRTGASVSYQITNRFPAGGAWQAPVSTNSLSGDSREIQVDLRIGQTPDPKETLQSILRQAPVKIAYFANATIPQFQLSPNSASFSTNNPTGTANVTLAVQTDTNLFKEAFPGFEGALTSSKAVLTMTNTADKIFTNFTLIGTLQGIQAQLTLARPSGTNLLQSWILEVTYPSSLPGETPIPVNTNFSVTWGK
jgi:hypothetical protein